MPAGGETLICGQYTVTWNSVALGTMEGDASVPTLEHTTKAELVNKTDRFGGSTIDAVYQGADWFAQFIAMEWRTGTISAWWPFGTLGLLGVVGRLYFALSGPLVLTAIAGTPAAASPATCTCPKAILAPGFNTRILFGPTIRKVPIRMQLFLADTGSSVFGWFTTT